VNLVPHDCERCGRPLNAGESHLFGCADPNMIVVTHRVPPIPMVLFCPVCQMQHIDAPKPEIGWEDPPHKSHECQGCKAVWRPCDLATTGVKEIQTRGKADTWPSVPTEIPAARMDAPDGPVCWCGAPSRKESGWCGRDNCLGSSNPPRCVCRFGVLVDDCPIHGYLVPP